jgi:signal transduction histidine kinase
MRRTTQASLRRLERTGGLEPAELRVLLGRLDREARSLSRRVDLVLSAMRLELAWMPLRVVREDVHQLLAQAVSDAQAATDEHAFRLDAPAGAVWASVDALRIEQVFLAVLDTALELSPAGGPIDVTLRGLAGRAVLVSVRDYGPGIPEVDLERIFERSYQVEAAASVARMSGVGLGLFVARTIVQAHGGSIRAESPATGGTCVELRLPAVPPMAASIAYGPRSHSRR